MFHRPLIKAYICAALILLVCLMPGSSLPGVNVEWLALDKLVHFIMYVPLTWLLAFGFKNQTRYPQLKKRYLMYAFITSCIYGALIELLQFAIAPDRAAELYDFFADALGSAIGIFSFRFGEWLINQWDRIFRLR